VVPDTRLSFLWPVARQVGIIERASGPGKEALAPQKRRKGAPGRQKHRVFAKTARF
jgi:hypothetical protein